MDFRSSPSEMEEYLSDFASNSEDDMHDIEDALYRQLNYTYDDQFTSSFSTNEERLIEVEEIKSNIGVLNAHEHIDAASLSVSEGMNFNLKEIIQECRQNGGSLEENHQERKPALIDLTEENDCIDLTNELSSVSSRRKRLYLDGKSAALLDRCPVKKRRKSLDSDVSSDSDVCLDVTPNGGDHADLLINVDGQMALTSDKEYLKKILDSLDDCKWTISLHDQRRSFNSRSRYYCDDNKLCNGCGARGHKARDCKASAADKLKPACLVCSSRAHQVRFCPQAACVNCMTCGHDVTRCPYGRRSAQRLCHRCNMPRHHAEECPDVWRQFHDIKERSTTPKASERSLNKRKFCPNCATAGHFIQDCKYPLMDKAKSIQSPIVRQYRSYTFRDDDATDHHQRRYESAKFAVRSRSYYGNDRPQQQPRADYRFAQNECHYYADGRCYPRRNAFHRRNLEEEQDHDGSYVSRKEKRLAKKLLFKAEKKVKKDQLKKERKKIKKEKKMKKEKRIKKKSIDSVNMGGSDITVSKMKKKVKEKKEKKQMKALKLKVETDGLKSTRKVKVDKVKKTKTQTRSRLAAKNITIKIEVD